MIITVDSAIGSLEVTARYVWAAAKLVDEDAVRAWVASRRPA